MPKIAVALAALLVAFAPLAPCAASYAPPRATVIRVQQVTKRVTAKKGKATVRPVIHIHIRAPRR